MQRYSDAPAVVLETLTDVGFAAAKISTWLDRAAPRDLFDLHALAQAGKLTTDAANLVRKTTNWTAFSDRVVWPYPPTELDWRMQLAHQTRLDLEAAEAHRLVVATLEKLGAGTPHAPHTLRD